MITRHDEQLNSQVCLRLLRQLNVLIFGPMFGPFYTALSENWEDDFEFQLWMPMTATRGCRSPVQTETTTTSATTRP